MRLEIMGFRQDKLIELKLSAEDIILLRWFIDFKGTDRMEEYVNPEDGQAYYWVKGSKVVQDLPIITKSEDYAARKFSKLCDCGILKKYSLLTRYGRKPCYRVSGEALVGLLVNADEATVQNTTVAIDSTVQNTTVRTVQNTTVPLYIINNKKDNTCDSKIKNNYSSEPSEEAPSSPVFIELPLNNGSLFAVTEEQVNKWSKLYPAVDVRQQLRTMLGWCESNPTKRKTSKGIARFVNSWLAREQDRGGSKKSYSGTNAQVSNPISNAAFAGAKGGEEEW